MIELIKKLGKKEKQKETICSMVVVAAGNATRMEGKDKLFLNIHQAPILAHTLEALNQNDYIHELILVTRKDLIVDVGKLCKEFQIHKATKIMVGGKERIHSVLAGVREVREDATIIGIHDAARPFISQDLINEVILSATRNNAVAPAIPVIDTIKQAQNNMVEKTLNRETLWAVQTPQVFQASLIKGALEQAIEEEVILTDDCSAVERLGVTVTLTTGSRHNIKITTPLDITLAEAIQQQSQEELS